MPKYETIVACRVSLGIFKAKTRPENICFSRPSLGLKNIKGISVRVHECVHECVRITKLQKGRKKSRESRKIQDFVE